jgi:hypothetical protein
MSQENKNKIIEEKSEKKKIENLQLKSLKKWNNEEVQKLFKSGIFTNYTNCFDYYDGKSLLKLSNEDCKDILKDDSIGILLYHKIQDLEEGKKHLKKKIKKKEGKIKKIKEKKESKKH